MNLQQNKSRSHEICNDDPDYDTEFDAPGLEFYHQESDNYYDSPRRQKSVMASETIAAVAICTALTLLVIYLIFF